MPYKRKGRKIYHKKNGKWKLKQTATSVKKAKSTMRLLHGIEYGWKPTKTTKKVRKRVLVRGHKRKGKKVKPHYRKVKKKITFFRETAKPGEPSIFDVSDEEARRLAFEDELKEWEDDKDGDI